MKAKQYILTSLLLMMIFLLYHFSIWNLLTKQFVEVSDNVRIGDLGRMSYSSNSLTKRLDDTNLSRQHINFSSENMKAEIITIGDSFSHAGAGGLNSYYQDYIATDHNKTVMNIKALPQGFIETILILNNNGILDELEPKIIILESVEREILRRYSKKINWDINKDKEYVNKYLLKNNKNNNNMKKPFFINNLNYNSVLYNLLYDYDDNAFYSKVYKAQLSKALFTCIASDTLLFINDDLSDLSLYSKRNIALINDNLNKLQKILEKKNIKLYFMPAVDKYNLYSKYIIDNKYKKNVFFETMRPLKKEYEFVDTKMILEKMLDNNVTDIYYSDDTHWGFKASKEIVNKIKLNLL